MVMGYPKVIGRVEIPTTENKGTCSCDRCKVMVSPSWGDSRTEVRVRNSDGKVRTQLVCDDCINEMFP